jgi:preprotein translocase subunit SecG
MTALLMLLLSFVAIFLILLVLIQRGRGGGLAGAFGGMGGQSAFGTKAGDVFTRITIVVATVWILLCIAAVKMLNSSATAFDKNLGSNRPTAPAGAPAEGGTGAAPSNEGAAKSETPVEGAAKSAAPATTPAPSSTPAPASAPASEEKK